MSPLQMIAAIGVILVTIFVANALTRITRLVKGISRGKLQLVPMPPMEAEILLEKVHEQIDVAESLGFRLIDAFHLRVLDYHSVDIAMLESDRHSEYLSVPYRNGRTWCTVN